MKNLLKIIIFFSSCAFYADSFASGAAITKDTFGCKDYEQVRVLKRYLADGDQIAFKNTVSRVLHSGKCTFFNTGDHVFITDSKFFSGLAKVRKPGGVDEFWIDISTFKLSD